MADAFMAALGGGGDDDALVAAATKMEHDLQRRRTDPGAVEHRRQQKQAPVGSPMAELPAGVELAEDAVRGRHLVATRAFRRGELVLSQAPYRAVLDEAHSATHCDSTFEAGDGDGKALLRCSRSKLARYSSRQAQKDAWRDGYKEECAALVRCAPRVPPPTVRLAARCLWRRQRDRERPATAVGGWQSYEALCSLQHHWGALPPARKQLYAQMAVLVRAFMCGPPAADAAGGDAESAAADAAAEAALWNAAPTAEAGSTAEAAAEEEEEDPQADESDGLPSTKSIALLLARFAANAHTIANEELSPIGVGIFPLASMVNHSCTPTTAQIFTGSTIGFYAMAAISVGDEITISYVELIASRQERRRALRSHYFFDIDDADDNDTTGLAEEGHSNGTGAGAAGWDREVIEVRDGQRCIVKASSSAAGAGAMTPAAGGGGLPDWRTDPADDDDLCGLAWYTLTTDGVAAIPTSSLEYHPAVATAGGYPSGSARDGFNPTPSMLEEMLGKGLAGASLWDQPVGDDPNPPAPQPGDAELQQQQEAEDAEDGVGVDMNRMLGTLPEGTMRPRHSAAAIDAMDDPTQEVHGGGEGGEKDGDQKEEEEAGDVGELRVWGDAEVVAVLKAGVAGGGETLVLLNEIAAAGRREGQQTQQGQTEEGADVATLTALLVKCDCIAVAVDTGKALGLGAGHVLRLRLQAALLHTAIAAGEWTAAVDAAEYLTPRYDKIYPAGSPLLGLHWATVAKLLQFVGGGEQRNREALAAAEHGLRILTPLLKHRRFKQAGANGGDVLAQLEQVRSEAALEMAQSAQQVRQGMLGGGA